MHPYFFSIYQYLQRKKLTAIGLFTTLFIVLFFGATRIKFSEDITNLIPSNDKSDVTAKVLKQMNFADKISVIISLKKKGNSNDLTACANDFLNDLNTQCNGYVSKVQGKIDEENLQETFDFVYNHLPLFLDNNDYKTIQNKIKNDSVAASVASNYKSVISPTGIVAKNFILKDPLGISFIALKKLQQLSIGSNFQLQDGYVLTMDKQNLLLFITPKLAPNETDKNTLFVQQLNTIKNKLNTTYQDKVSLSFFGATPVAVGNANQIKADVQLTSIFASIVLILLLAFFYRSVTTPIIIFIPSLFGAVFALTILYFTKGSISAISLGISSILLGETTDYSIYVLTHLRNNKNVKLLYKDISKPLLLCGITTSITFLCLYFVKSEALKDLGVFAALSVTATTIFSLLLIPLLYKVDTKGNQFTTLLFKNKNTFLDKLASYEYHKNKILVIGMFLLLVICFFTYSKVGFNNDLAALNFISPEMKQTERHLEKITSGHSKSIYLATYGNSYQEVLQNNSKLFEILQQDKNKGTIINFSSIGGIVFSEQIQQQKINQWNTFWDNNKKQQLKKLLLYHGSVLGFKPNTYQEFYTVLDKNFTTVPLTEYLKVKSFFLNEFVSKRNNFYTISTLVKVSKHKRDNFVKKVKQQQNIVVIDRQQTNETFLSTLKNNFSTLVDYSFIAVFIVLLIAFKRIELVIVSIIPIMISWVFTTGVMGIFGLQFNVINIIVCTLIFGIGVDYSIFMTSALQKEHTYGKIQLPSYRSSIMLSVSTTILGIGVLVFAKHPALQSISIIAVIGIFSSLLITFIIQPLVFNFLITSRVAKGKAPFQGRTFVHGILSFTYYGLGGIFVSIFSMTILPIIPLKEETKMKGFRYVISKFMKSVLYTNPFVTKKVINTTHETFNKPAVIIANHTSFLDILAIGMLSPRIIYLVSDWVYNSPVFGAAVKKAGFYPVSQGIDGGVEHLTEKIALGYSVIVFPEGTRSESNQIKRFHKGAFYLAEHFNLDIIPIIIHGNSELLPKGDSIIYDGKLTLNILPRITPSNQTFGNNYAERTKKISTYFKSEFNTMRSEIEDPNYFKKTIIGNYIYKESKIVKTVKLDLNQNLLAYYKLNKQLSRNAKILHIANDYGQLDMLLLLQQPERKITSFIINDEQRDVANTNYIIHKRNIHYIHDITTVAQNKYDVVLLSTHEFDKTKINLALFDNIITLEDFISNIGIKN